MSHLFRSHCRPKNNLMFPRVLLPMVGVFVKLPGLPILTLYSISEAISRDPRCPMVRPNYYIVQGEFFTFLEGPSKHRAGRFD